MADVFKQDLRAAISELIAEGLTEGYLNMYKEQQDELARVRKEQQELKYAGSIKNAEFSKITNEMANLFYRKNLDYGDAFGKSIDEDGLLVSKIRLGDKYFRFCKLINGEPEVKDESIRDTLIDMANYAVMTIMWMDAKNEHKPSNDSGYNMNYEPTSELFGTTARVIVVDEFSDLGASELEHLKGLAADNHEVPKNPVKVPKNQDY